MWCKEIDFISKQPTILDAQLFLLPQNVLAGNKPSNHGSHAQLLQCQDTAHCITPYPHFSHKVLNFTLQFRHSLNFSGTWPLQTARVCCSKYCVSVAYAVQVVLVAELKQNFLHSLSLFWKNVQQGCMNPGHQVAQAAKFCMVALSMCGSWMWKSLYITLLAPRMSRWLLEVQKICGPLLYSTLCATLPCVSVLTSFTIIKWPPLVELLYFFKCLHPYCILERERRIAFFTVLIHYI
jgi:hypothetical protein